MLGGHTATINRRRTTTKHVLTAISTTGGDSGWIGCNLLKGLHLLTCVAKEDYESTAVRLSRNMYRYTYIGNYSCSRAKGRSENPGVPVLFGWQNRPPPQG